MTKYASVFIISCLLLFSCKPKKNLVYMSNDNFAQEVSQAKFSGLHIQEGDQIQIQVTAYEAIAVRPFDR